MKWYPFDKSKGSYNKCPPIYKMVLVFVESLGPGRPQAICAGYRKDAAGDGKSPYFVIPGHGGEVIAWCDCLPEDATNIMTLYRSAMDACEKINEAS